MTANDDSLLAALCRLKGTQGGTIHQFFHDAHGNSAGAMMESYRDYRKCGMEFTSRAALNKLARLYHLEINWGPRD
jgi:hypothetical protein